MRQEEIEQLARRYGVNPDNYISEHAFLRDIDRLRGTQTRRMTNFTDGMLRDMMKQCAIPSGLFDDTGYPKAKHDKIEIKSSTKLKSELLLLLCN